MFGNAQAGLHLYCSQTLKTDFRESWPLYDELVSSMSVQWNFKSVCALAHSDQGLSFLPEEIFGRSAHLIL